MADKNSEIASKRKRAYFLIVIIIIFSASVSYEITMKNLYSKGSVEIFLANFITAIILMSLVSLGVVWYVFRSANLDNKNVKKQTN